MTKRIVYPNDEGGISIITPNPDCGIPYDQIALKDVPAGKPYLIMDTVDVPTDRTFREAWDADFSNPHGHALGHFAWVETQPKEEESKAGK